jgi:hypothetical protein
MFVYAVASAFALTVVPAVAAPITEGEKQYCRADYKRYCGAYSVGSEGLRACMSRSVRRLSHMCVEALVDAKEMTRAEASKLRKKAPPRKHVAGKRTQTHKGTHRRR